MIDLLLDDDQVAVLDAVKAFLSREIAEDAGGSGFDRAMWERCSEQGWFSLTVADSDGGMGLSVAEEILLCREIGRHRLPLNFLSTLTAVRLAAGLEHRQLLSDLVAGKLVVGLAERHRDGRLLAWDDGPVDAILVLDHTTGAVQLTQGLELTGEASESTIDPEISLVTVADDPAPTLLLDAGPLAEEVWVHGAVLAAAMMTGIAEEARDESVAYAKLRVQYGKPIGTFQAVKHRCADMALRAERAWAQTMVAALQIRAGGRSACFEGYAAKVVAADAAIRNSRDNIQNHGGIGFTTEHPANLVLKRAHILESAFGSGRQHLPRIIDLESTW